MSIAEEYQQKVAATAVLLQNYFDHVTANIHDPIQLERRQKHLLRMLKALRRQFETEVSASYLFSGNCPPGYKQCRPGVCVPDDQSCDDWSS
jgi:hypothetical protein